MRRKKTYIWSNLIRGIVILVIAIPALIAINSRRSSLENLPRVKVERGEFVVSIDELGVFQAEKKTIITAPFGGKVVKILPEGTQVRAGQTVMWLDTEDVVDQLETEITQLKSVKMDLESSIADLLDGIKKIPLMQRLPKRSWSLIG